LTVALAEARLGLGLKSPHFAYITVGTGINANYVCNNQIYNREYRSEFGPIIIAPEGDALAADILARAANYLAIGIFNLANVFSLQRFVIDGGIPEAGEAFWRPLVEAVRKYEYRSGEIQLQEGELKGDAALLGAGLLALDQAFETIASAHGDKQPNE
jgi:predicted NBD/HSP70 family sugar kinase